MHIGRMWNKVSEQFLGADANEEWHEYIKDFRVILSYAIQKTTSDFGSTCCASAHR